MSVGTLQTELKKGLADFHVFLKAFFFSIGYIHNKIWEKVKEMERWRKA